MIEQFVVWIENTGIGKRMVAKTHSRARHEYTTKPEQALIFYKKDDAKQFARTWCQRTGCMFAVQSLLTQKFVFEVKQCG